IANQTYINLVYMILSSIIISIISILYFALTYYQGVIGFNSNIQSNKTHNNKGAKNYSITRWFFFREFKELSSGIVFFNTLFGNIILVVAYLAMIIYTMSNDSTNQELILTYTNDLDLPKTILFTIIITTLFSISNFGVATAFSREASNLKYLKSLPIVLLKLFGVKYYLML
ncbi:MAG: hypothetical protein ACRCTA_03860, partial [Bacilli bacterium]